VRKDASNPRFELFQFSVRCGHSDGAKVRLAGLPQRG
jgi:hypothetical protein